jgi:hypothetical protein
MTCPLDRGQTPPRQRLVVAQGLLGIRELDCVELSLRLSRARLSRALGVWGIRALGVACDLKDAKVLSLAYCRLMVG